MDHSCGGHPGYAEEVYAFDYPGPDKGMTTRSWLCKPCWLKTYQQVHGGRVKRTTSVATIEPGVAS